ncbi:hypothetical protein EMIT0P43_30434 [Pseudomonas jessenii]
MFFLEYIVSKVVLFLLFGFVLSDYVLASPKKQMLLQVRRT